MKHILTISALALGLALTGWTAQAQTADGETPAVETICETSGLSGKALGLCNAYCEAMDCDSPEPQASAKACERVLSKIELSLPEGSDLALCDDEDGDGIANGLDNCPQVPNQDQADNDPSTPEGYACEIPVAACPCFSAQEASDFASRPADYWLHDFGGNRAPRFSASTGTYFAWHMLIDLATGDNIYASVGRKVLNSSGEIVDQEECAVVSAAGHLAQYEGDLVNGSPITEEDINQCVVHILSTQ